jgi:sucrose-phosphate synthase
MHETSDTGPSLPPPGGGPVFVYGEVLYDHYPDGSRALGGAPFNVAWHLCGLGLPPFFISVVGDDDEGRLILDQMQGWGLSVEGVRVDDQHPTGRVEVTEEGGSPVFGIPAGQAWDHMPALTDLKPAWHGPSLLYHGTLALRSEETAESFRQLRRAVEAPVLVDLNLRDPWWTRATVDEVLGGADWAKVSAEELAIVADAEQPASIDKVETLARTVLDRYGLSRVVVTRGGDGAVLVTEGGDAFRASAIEVPEIVDTVGAGDAFCAVVALGIVRGWDDEVILNRANEFAADICRFQGATVTDLSLYDSHLRHWAELPWRPTAQGDDGRRLRILSLSVHGLVRGVDMELGRDADTGGQVAYVVEQARALAEHPAVEHVDLVTRQVFDRNVDDAYAQPTENIAPGARIVRLPFGPRRYLHKESLWPFLDTLLDELLHYVRSSGRLPDVIHGHYADAGYVGAQLSKLLGVPFVFTGHSLGRVKRSRLLADGASEEVIESRYRLTRRTEAEEQALEAADLVIASTRQEVGSQYEGYDHYRPHRMEVIPPGVDLTRFAPPSRFWPNPAIRQEVERFLRDPDKPMVLVLARADERKNFGGVLEAYARTPGLREAANLVLVAGNRDDVQEMNPAPRRVLNGILLDVDRYDLYGSVAYPKRHSLTDVPDLYRMAARSRGVLVNAALTEPFGLTLIEAAASGLPVVATEDGGPRDILGVLEHGVLVDVLDTTALGEAILEAISDGSRWARWAKNGVSRVHENFSWRSHARRYVTAVNDVLSGRRPGISFNSGTRLPHVDRLLVTDVDDTLTGDEEALAALAGQLEQAGDHVGFAVATGRALEPALEVLQALAIRTPDLFITASGTAVHYGSRLIRDRSWERQIRYRWQPDEIQEVMTEQAGVLFDSEDSTPYRIRYRFTTGGADLAALHARLRRAGLLATLLVDHGRYLDIIPGRASPGMAVRFLAFKWDLPPHRILVAGDSGNDADMISGETLGVVVGNHTDELESLRDHPRVYFSPHPHATGVVDGIEYYDFFDAIRTRDEETG